MAEKSVGFLEIASSFGGPLLKYTVIYFQEEEIIYRDMYCYFCSVSSTGMLTRCRLTSTGACVTARTSVHKVSQCSE
jgi:hypothetical protein